MANVPTETVQSRLPSGAMAATETQQATPNDFGAQVGAAEQGLGANIENTAGDLSRIAIAKQGIINEQYANDALNKLEDQQNDLAYNPQSGFMTMKGRNAVDAYDNTITQNDQIRQDIHDSIPNPVAQRMFDNAARRQTAISKQRLDAHASQQSSIWNVQTSEARVQTSIDTASLNYNDDRAFGATIGTIKAEAQKQSEIQGWSPEETNLKIQQDWSKAIVSRATAQAQHDPQAALDFYRQNIGNVDPTQRDNMSSMLQNTVALPRASSVAGTIMSGGAIANCDAVYAAMEDKESKGLQNAVSGKGAVGVMQLMPDTAMQVAKELGLPFDMQKLSKDADYNRQLGQKYFNDMCERYQGNQTLALAAYNAGPANVDKWVKQYGQPGNDPQSQSAWIDKIPFSETQDYVQSINSKVPPQAGTPPTSNDVTDHTADWHAQANNLPSGPVRDLAKAEISNRANTIAQGQWDAARTNQQTLGTALTTGAVQSVDDLRSNPAYQMAWAKAGPEVQRNINAAIAAQKKEVDPVAAAKTWYGLKGMAVDDPAAFAKEDLTQYLTTITPDQFKDLANLQTKAAKNQSMVSTISATQLKSVGDPMLGNANLPVGGKSDPEKQTYREFYGQFQNAVEQWQNTNKADPSRADLQKIAAGLLPNVTTQSHWYGDTKTPLFKAVSEIPALDQTQINDAFKAKVGRDPSPQEVYDIYSKTKAGRK